MTKTLSDKIIMMVLTLLFTAGEVFASGSFEIGIPTVVPVISAALVYGLSEVLNNKIFVFISAAASVALTFFFPEYWVLLPAAVYAAATLEDFNLYIRIAIIAVSTAASFATGIPGVFKVLVLIIVACFTAYKTNAYIASEKKLIGTFDKAREDLIREQERRIRLKNDSENNIYLATLKERNRIARDIHDNVGHILTRTIVQMQALLVIDKDENARPYLESVNESLNNAMTSIRKSVHELHDDSIDLSLGLNDLIKGLDKRFETKLVTSIDSPTSNEFKNMVLSIVKEALTNASKYSNGDRIRVEVMENNTFWRILVNDNGRNKKADYTNEDFEMEGIGLGNIRGRALAFNGSARIFADETGFTVLVTVPKEDKNDKSTDS